MSTKKRIVLFGGSGFVGQAIAKEAINQHYEVISISFHGQPRKTQNFMQQVTWVKADVFVPDTWKDVVQPGDIVIDAIGILFEHPKKGITYEKFHYQAAKTIAQESKNSKVSQIIYISAAYGLPFFKGYLKEKLRAEKIMVHYFPQATIIRPDFMYGANRPLATFIAKAILFSKKIPGVNMFFKKMTPQPVEKVAQYILQHIPKNETDPIEK